MHHICVRDPLILKEPRAQTHQDQSTQHPGPQLFNRNYKLPSLRYVGLPCSFIAGYRTKSICEHVKLALGLLLHCSSRVYFKGRKN